MQAIAPLKKGAADIVYAYFIEYSKDLLSQVQSGNLVAENFTFHQHD